MGATITIENAVKRYGKETIINGLSLEIKPGEFFTLLGPSGCGKTTLLRMIIGFNSIEGGTFKINDRVINDIPTNKRNIGMVFQNYAVFPHMNVFDNVAFGLKNRKLPKEEIEKKVNDILKIVKIDHLKDRMPANLSGGQQQRVALARALVIEPSVLLFDEPLSNLDAKLRVTMRTEIRRIQQEVGITAIYVTHDQSEAMALSDNIIIMKNGVVEQMGTPQEIYYHPVNEFVADFIGEANFLKGTMTGSDGAHARLTIEGHEMTVAGRDGMQTGETYTVVLRPESGHLADAGGLPCKVVVSCFMGSYQNYHVMVGDTLVKLAEHNPKNKRIYQVGEACQLVFDPEEVHVL